MIDKVYEILNIIDSSDLVLRYKKLKEDITNDISIKNDLDDLKKLSNEYSQEYIEIKKKLITNPKIKEYKQLENKLYFLTLDINKKLKIINDKKSCSL